MVGPLRLGCCLRSGARAGAKAQTASSGQPCAPDLGALSDGAEGCVLQQRLDLLGRLGVGGAFRLQEDDAGVVGGVEHHLGGGLADRLGSQCAHHLPRLHPVLQEAVLDLAQQPVEGLRRQPMLAQHALRGELRAEEREEVVGGVVLRLDRERVDALDDGQLGRQFAHLA
eukprot:scaffold4556_cov114-Isochrysis_galbana.AAC.13